MANVVGNWGGGAVWQITSGAFPSNAYFCEANVPGGGVLIDAGLDGAAIDEQLNAAELTQLVPKRLVPQCQMSQDGWGHGANPLAQIVEQRQSLHLCIGFQGSVITSLLILEI